MSVVTTSNDVRGLLVQLGLGSPLARGFLAGAVSTGVLYALKMPSAAFNKDGQLRDFKLLSAEPDATYAHFLLYPVIIASAVVLFT